MESLNEDVPDDPRIIRQPDFNFPLDEKGIGHAFFTIMPKHKDKIAQIDTTTGEKETYVSLFQRCIRTAITMQSKGITSNDMVVICSNNQIDNIVPYVASFFIGAKVASLDPNLTLDEMTYLIRQVEPNMIFAISESVKMIEEVAADISLNTEIVVFGETDTHTEFLEFTQPKVDEEKFKPVPKNLKETALIMFSSGTSGMPKGICLSHLLLLAQAEVTRSIGLDITVSLGFASLYWITSVLIWNMVIISGATRLVVPRLDPANIWEVIHRFKPTYALFAPIQILSMDPQKKQEHFRTDSLKDLYVAGASMLEEQMLRIKNMFPNTRVSLCYGQTELGGFGTCFKPNNSLEMSKMAFKSTSSGGGLIGMSYKIVNPDTGELLGPYQEGELRIKSLLQMSGYYNLDARDSWDEDGWLKTGDIAYYDKDKCFYVLDRCKEMLKFQMWHVPPAAIENVILSHPSVKHAVVIGIPHEVDTDHPMGIVTLREGHQGQIKPDDIEKYVEQRVHDRQRLRGGVKIVNHLPLSPSGKVKRNEVKKMMLHR